MESECSPLPFALSEIKVREFDNCEVVRNGPPANDEARGGGGAIALGKYSSPSKLNGYFLCGIEW